MPAEKRFRVGPGKLYSGAVGALEPADTISATFAGVTGAPWTYLGLTDEGSTFTISPEFEDIEAAEVNLPLDIVKVKEDYSVEFSLLAVTAANMALVLNGGTVTTVASVGKTFEPLAADAAPIYVALGWQSNLNDERYVWRKCLQTGDIEIARRKSPDKASLPASFRVVQPTTGAPFKYMDLD